MKNENSVIVVNLFVHVKLANGFPFHFATKSQSGTGWHPITIPVQVHGNCLVDSSAKHYYMLIYQQIDFIS